MPRIDCTRLQFVSVLTLAILAATVGCGEDAQSPTAPELGPAVAGRAAHELSFRQVSAGFSDTCGVTSDNSIYCWGQNTLGQLGDGTTTDRLTPVAVVGGLRFRQVSAGARHTCGITLHNVAYCWGANFAGQLGDGTSTDRPTPVAVAGGLRFREVSASANGDHTCGVTTENVAYCWGANFNAQLGDGTTNNFRPTPVAVAGGLRFRQVTAGGIHTCGVVTGHRAYCWGTNFFGQFGNGMIDNGPQIVLTPTPVAVAGGLRFHQVDAGSIHTCGLTPRNFAYCWGNNEFGLLGDGTTTNRLTPVAVAGGLRFRQVSAGENFHTCGVTTANVAYCWGRNFSGLLGDGTTANHPTPVAVAGGLRFRQVSAGSVHTCGVATGNRAFCWGNNLLGQLGDGTTSAHFTPVAVAPPAP
jgi:alpha-tubulin suppressor-like RCC1 family protein